MADKVKEIEERLDKLENRLKVTFLEIEKRFESFKEEQPLSIEDRLQELEDLLLLIQLEITKMKEGGSPLEFSMAAPDVNERLNKLEETALSHAPVPVAAAAVHGRHEVKHEAKQAAHEAKHVVSKAEHDTAYAEMEQRIRELEEQSRRPLPFVEWRDAKKADAEFSDKLKEIEKKLKEMENRRLVSDKGTVVVHHKDVLEDVRKILHAR